MGARVSKPRVLLADDHRMVAEGLKGLLTEEFELAGIVEDGRAMVKAARKYDRVFQTGSMQRSMSEFRKACELVRNGRIGQIKQVIVDVGGPSKPCDLPEEKKEEGKP